MKTHRNKKAGQTMVEYIIIVVIIAIAAIAIFGLFSDTIREKLGGAVVELGGDESAVEGAMGESAHDYLKDLDSEGAGN